jgi:hypothetical protein
MPSRKEYELGVFYHNGKRIKYPSMMEVISWDVVRSLWLRATCGMDV